MAAPAEPQLLHFFAIALALVPLPGGAAPVLEQGSASPASSASPPGAQSAGSVTPAPDGLVTTAIPEPDPTGTGPTEEAEAVSTPEPDTETARPTAAAADGARQGSAGREGAGGEVAGGEGGGGKLQGEQGSLDPSPGPQGGSRDAPDRGASELEGALLTAETRHGVKQGRELGLGYSYPNPQPQRNACHSMAQRKDIMNDEEDVVKHIYVHLPGPEPSPEPTAAPRVLTPRRRKHYKIVFIKPPTAPPPPPPPPLVERDEERTFIYVLVPRAATPAPVTITVPATARTPTKPEVYFIRYKAPANASARAQPFEVTAPSEVTTPSSATTLTKTATPDPENHRFLQAKLAKAATPGPESPRLLQKKFTEAATTDPENLRLLQVPGSNDDVLNEIPDDIPEGASREVFVPLPDENNRVEGASISLRLPMAGEDKVLTKRTASYGEEEKEEDESLHLFPSSGAVPAASASPTPLDDTDDILSNNVIPPGEEPNEPQDTAISKRSTPGQTLCKEFEGAVDVNAELDGAGAGSVGGGVDFQAVRRRQSHLGVMCPGAGAQGQGAPFNLPPQPPPPPQTRIRRMDSGGTMRIPSQRRFSARYSDESS